MKPRVRTWPKEKIESFLRCWEEGLTAMALTERFGHRADHVVRTLRAAGYVLAPRTGSPLISRDRIHRPEDAVAAWRFRSPEKTRRLRAIGLLAIKRKRA